MHAVLAARDGVELVTWTFDPLQAANANLNFRKLGAVCRTYLPDCYGPIEYEFGAGLPTDRFLVEWRPGGDRVRARLAGDVPTPEDLAKLYSGAPIIARGDRIDAGAKAWLLTIPSGVHELARRDPRAAGQDLADFRVTATALIDAGYAATQMIRSGVIGDRQYYVFEKEDR